MASPDSISPNSDVFPRTRWSLVIAAGDRADAPQAQRALAELCQLYWKPIYIYFRGKGQSPEDSQDITQDFFAHLLSRGSLAQADSERGKLRAYLLGAAKHFLINDYRKRSAQKRGGGAQVLSVDHADAEEQLGGSVSETDTPETLFERSWARTLIDGVVSAMEEEYSESGKAEHFALLKPSLLSESDARPQRELARELGMSLAAIKVAVFRLRQKFRERLEKEIVHTLEDPAELEGEVVHLLGLWAG